MSKRKSSTPRRGAQSHDPSPSLTELLPLADIERDINRGEFGGAVCDRCNSATFNVTPDQGAPPGWMAVRLSCRWCGTVWGTIDFSGPHTLAEAIEVLNK